MAGLAKVDYFWWSRRSQSAYPCSSQCLDHMPQAFGCYVVMMFAYGDQFAYPAPRNALITCLRRAVDFVFNYVCDGFAAPHYLRLLRQVAGSRGSLPAATSAWPEDRHHRLSHGHHSTLNPISLQYLRPGETDPTTSW